MRNKFYLYLAAFIVPPICIIVAFSINVYAGIFVTIATLLFILLYNRANLLTLMGQREYGKGNNNKALTILKKAHELSDRRPSNSITYAYILLRCGNTDEAARILNYVLLNKNLKPNVKMTARQNLSLVRYRQGDITEARRLMELVFEQYKTTGVYGALGYYKILAADSDAEQFCLEAYDFNADDKVIIDNLVQIYLEKGEPNKAKELSDKSIDAGNKGIEIYYHAGQVAVALCDTETAAEMFKLALSCRRSFMTTVSETEIESALEKC